MGWLDDNFKGLVGSVRDEVVYPMIRTDNRVVRAAADVGSKLTGGYLKERADNLKHEADTNIESPSKSTWKAAASIAAWYGSGLGEGYGGAGAEAGAGAGAEAGAGTEGAMAGGGAELGTSGAADAGMGSYGYGPGEGSGSWSGSTMDGGAGGAGNTGATNPALIESGSGTEGYGASSAGPGNANYSWYDQMAQYARSIPSGLKTANAMMQVYQGADNMYSSWQRRRQQQEYARKIQELQSNPNSVTNTPGYGAGLEAVQRSMAAQGYTGSGNVATALQKYGGDFYQQQLHNLMQLQGPAVNNGDYIKGGTQLGAGLAYFA